MVQQVKYLPCKSDLWNLHEVGSKKLTLQMSVTTTHMLWYTRVLTYTSSTYTHYTHRLYKYDACYYNTKVGDQESYFCE